MSYGFTDEAKAKFLSFREQVPIGEKFSYFDFEKKMGTKSRESLEAVNWAVGEELAKPVSRGVFEMVGKESPIIYDLGPMMNLTCQGCGDKFKSQKFRKFCTDTCRVKHTNILKIVCKACGREFKAHRNRKFCTPTCRYQFFEKKKDEAFEKSQQNVKEKP